MMNPYNAFVLLANEIQDNLNLIADQIVDAKKSGSLMVPGLIEKRKTIQEIKTKMDKILDSCQEIKKE